MSATHQYTEKRLAVRWYDYYSDNTSADQFLVSIHHWDIEDLERELEGKKVPGPDGTSRTVMAGPDRHGRVMFEDGSEAFLHCEHFFGQDTLEGRIEVRRQDRQLREEAGLVWDASKCAPRSTL
ncbi:hypothetical protein HN358_01455 [Candidatus Uhrbacteria bacterium]|nr:hypothetical protein [Candidatus Uhrbacteria bacterium]MBT7717304.1 hypothetical protein [Candidatus Uhrbacteria bacterium]